MAKSDCSASIHARCGARGGSLMDPKSFGSGSNTVQTTELHLFATKSRRKCCPTIFLKSSIGRTRYRCSVRLSLQGCGLGVPGHTAGWCGGQSANLMKGQRCWTVDYRRLGDSRAWCKPRHTTLESVKKASSSPLLQSQCTQHIRQFPSGSQLLAPTA